jgi:hypothetical protein
MPAMVGLEEPAALPLVSAPQTAAQAVQAARLIATRLPAAAIRLARPPMEM